MPEPHLISVDGKLFPPGEAVLPLPDDGLLRGDGAFEVIRVYDGRPFALDEHLDRMESSARTIELPLDRPGLAQDVETVLDNLVDRDCLLRLVQTRGGRRIVSLEPLPVHSPAITLATVTYAPSVILDGVKSLSYAANMEATRIARTAGAEEALFVRPDGVVLEAPTSSIFWVTREGRLRTASLEAGVLDSITRRQVVNRLEVEQGEFPLQDLLDSTEAFLASTTREIQTVEQVNGTSIPTDGELTSRAAAAFQAALREALDS